MSCYKSFIEVLSGEEIPFFYGKIFPFHWNMSILEDMEKHALEELRKINGKNKVVTRGVQKTFQT